MPVNLIFVGMIWTSFFALKNLGVPMATVLKNVTNLFTIVGDYLLYGKVCQTPNNFKASFQLLLNGLLTTAMELWCTYMVVFDNWWA